MLIILSWRVTAVALGSIIVSSCYYGHLWSLLSNNYLKKKTLNLSLLAREEDLKKKWKSKEVREEKGS